MLLSTIDIRGSLRWHAVGPWCDFTKSLHKNVPIGTDHGKQHCAAVQAPRCYKSASLRTLHFQLAVDCPTVPLSPTCPPKGGHADLSAVQNRCFPPATSYKILLAHGDHRRRARGAPPRTPGYCGAFAGPMEQRGGFARGSSGLWGPGGGGGRQRPDHACDIFLFGGASEARTRVHAHSRARRASPPLAAAATGTTAASWRDGRCRCCRSERRSARTEALLWPSRT